MKQKHFDCRSMTKTNRRNQHSIAIDLAFGRLRWAKFIQSQVQSVGLIQPLLITAGVDRLLAVTHSAMGLQKPAELRLLVLVSRGYIQRAAARLIEGIDLCSGFQAKPHKAKIASKHAEMKNGPAEGLPTARFVAREKAAREILQTLLVGQFKRCQIGAIAAPKIRCVSEEGLGRGDVLQFDGPQETMAEYIGRADIALGMIEDRAYDIGTTGLYRTVDQTPGVRSLRCLPRIMEKAFNQPAYGFHVDVS